MLSGRVVDHLAHHRGRPNPQQLDGAQLRLLRAESDLEVKGVGAERQHRVGGLAGDGLGRADEEGAVGDLVVEARPGRAGPAALGTDAVVVGGVLRVEGLRGLLVRVCDEAGAVEGDGAVLGVAELVLGASVEVREGDEALGCAADDGQAQVEVAAREQGADIAPAYSTAVSA
mgnify:CR=1 FL=1